MGKFATLPGALSRDPLQADHGDDEFRAPRDRDLECAELLAAARIPLPGVPPRERLAPRALDRPAAVPLLGTTGSTRIPDTLDLTRPGRDEGCKHGSAASDRRPRLGLAAIRRNGGRRAG